MTTSVYFRRIAVIWFILFCVGLNGCIGDLKKQPLGDAKAIEKTSQSPAGIKQAAEANLNAKSQIETDNNVMGIYKKALLDEIEIFDTGTKSTLYLKDYRQGDFKNLAMEFTVVDLNGVGTPEVVLNFVGPDIRLVLYYEEGTVYGYIFGIKSLGTIKSDGSFSWGYATKFGWSTLNFLGETCETIDIAVFEYSQSSDTRKYVIENCEVHEEAFFEVVALQNGKDDVEWLMFSEESISASFAAVSP